MSAQRCYLRARLDVEKGNDLRVPRSSKHSPTG